MTQVSAQNLRSVNRQSAKVWLVDYFESRYRTCCPRLKLCELPS